MYVKNSLYTCTVHKQVEQVHKLGSRPWVQIVEVRVTQ